MKSTCVVASVFLLLLLFGCGEDNDSAAVTATLMQITTGRGAEIKYVRCQAQDPVAVLLLFPGGPGRIDLSGEGEQFSIGGGSGFTARNYTNFATQGFLTVLLDAPSDFYTENGMPPQFRIGTGHAADVHDLLEAVPESATLPVWVLGISMGSLSAANMGIRLTNRLQGLVLASCPTQPEPDGALYTVLTNGILDMQLGEIGIPVLVAYHSNDGCSETPASNAPAVVTALSNAGPCELRYFSGGDPGEGNPCGTTVYHSFWGLDGEVSAAMSDFIRAHLE